tara:strand:+ start:1435 stop:1845 length:411 start_codon:yes stop_codon:yes gene_type:complete
MQTETQRVQAQTNTEWLNEYEAGKKLTPAEQKKATRQRTELQNKAVWVWCTQVAEILHKNGLRFEVKVLKPIFIPYDKDLVHTWIYKPVLKAWTDKNSTKDMNTIEPSEVTTIISAHFATERAITLPAFPNWRDEG